jgi:hypothetical protein
MPTTGLFTLSDPAEPRNPASPKLKMPPSAATSQYPLPLGVAPLLQGGVVGLALHRQQVLEGTALPGRGM